MTDTASPLLACLGDSLTEGWRLRPDQAWPNLIRRRFRKRGLNIRVANHGISGGTMAGGLQRLEPILADRPRAVAVQFGANDAMTGVPPARFEQDLSLVVERLCEARIRGLIIPTLTLPILYDEVRTGYRAAFERVADRFRVPMTPCVLRDVADEPDRLLEDGFHPNALGMEAMADLLEAPLLELMRDAGHPA